MNQFPAIVAGNLTRDPLRWPSRRQAGSWPVATGPVRRYDQASQQWSDGATRYVDMSAWGPLAEHVPTTACRAHPQSPEAGARHGAGAAIQRSIDVPYHELGRDASSVTESRGDQAS
jgi:hypothetical protein